jgi:hypothetical protein
MEALNIETKKRVSGIASGGSGKPEEIEEGS